MNDAPNTTIDPALGSRWRHRTGRHYVVLHIANEFDTPCYPRTVVYQGPNGKVWTQPCSDWRRSMTEEKNA